MATATAGRSKGLRGQALAERIKADPKWFASAIFGVDLWPKQEEIVSSVFAHRRTAARGCVASTKTFAAAIATMAWLMAFPRDGRVFHLAPSFRQVDKNLFGYLKKLDRMAAENGTPTGAKVFAEPRLEFGPGWGYVGFSTKEPSNVHGIHGPNDLIVLDDAHGIPKELTDELENMMSSGNTRILMLFNPVVLSGETFECTHKQAALWNNIKVSFADLKAAYAAGLTLPGALQPEAVATWAAKYGVKSNFYLPKVDAEYPDQAPDTLIPMSWIEEAMDREVPAGGARVVGVDVAWTGDDSSVITVMEGRRVLPQEKYRGQDPMELADKVDVHLVREGTSAWVDTIGIGAGTYAREHQRGRDVHPFVASESAVGQWEGKEASEHFANVRAQAAWTLRTALDPKNPAAIALPRDLELQAQLSAITYHINKTSKVQLQAKDSMKKELGYSPDEFDSLCMAVWGAGGGSTDQPWSAWV